MEHYSKIKSLVLSILGLSSFSFKEGKAQFTEDQKKAIKAEFGNDFVDVFTKALEKEIADTSAEDKAKAANDALEALKAENARIIQAAKEEMEKELQAKLAAQADEYNEKIEKLSGAAEEDPPGTGSSGAAKREFRIDPSHAHNKYARAMMDGGLNAEIQMAGDTIDVDDLKSEFGTYITQKDKPVYKQLTTPTSTMKHMTTKVAITEWRAAYAEWESVVQQFISKWTPLSKGKLTALTIKNRRHKINVPITPDEINDSWLSHMYDEGLTPKEMPITKFIINQLILPRVEDDREMNLIASGEYEELPGGETDGDPGQATGKSMDGFITQLKRAYEAQSADPTANKFNFIKLGAVTSSNVVDKMESFIDQIDRMYRKKSKNVFTSYDTYKMYKRAYRDLFPTTKNADVSEDRIDYSQQRLQTLESMDGMRHFFTTPKENFIRLRHKNNGASKVWMQAENYDVKVFAEWWEAVGFAFQEAVQAYIDVVALCDEYAVKSDASALTASMLEDAGCTDVNSGNLAGYKSAIEAESGIADLAALQSIIDTVNA